MTIKKPLLAEKAELEEIPLPCIASPKLDGIRCLVINGKAVSRSLKPIPNHHIRNWIEANLPEGIDGEIMIKDMDFNSIQSAVMSRDGEPQDFVFCAFDLVDGVEEAKAPFVTRFNALSLFVANSSVEVRKHLSLVPHVKIETIEQLKEFELKCFNEEFEGVMTRRLDGPYKFNRSTLKEAILLKFKRWVDEEGEIIGFEEQLRNENEATEDELGHTKRSTHAENMVPANTLGTIIVRRLVNGQKCTIGTGLGLTAKLRKEIWDNQGEYLGKLVKFKHQVSPKDPPDMDPRFPSFQGFRHSDDMST